MEQVQLKYTNEFRRDALQMLLLSAKSPTQIEQEWGIKPGLLLTWQGQHERQVGNRFKSKPSYFVQYDVAN